MPGGFGGCRGCGIGGRLGLRIQGFDGGQPVGGGLELGVAGRDLLAVSALDLIHQLFACPSRVVAVCN